MKLHETASNIERELLKAHQSCRANSTSTVRRMTEKHTLISAITKSTIFVPHFFTSFNFICLLVILRVQHFSNINKIWTKYRIKHSVRLSVMRLQMQSHWNFVYTVSFKQFAHLHTVSFSLSLSVISFPLFARSILSLSSIVDSM